MTTLNSTLQLALLKQKKRKNVLQKGFTLVELMIVIVIVGILSAVALPNFLNQTKKARATEAQSNISAAFKNAQQIFLETNNLNNIGNTTSGACVAGLELPSGTITDGWSYTCQTSGSNLLTITASQPNIGSVVGSINVATGAIPSAPTFKEAGV